jgi:hypothetical protein
MNRIIASGLMTLNALILLSLPPVLAQSNKEKPECTAALQTAKNKITKGRKVKVIKIMKYDISQEYKDYPVNRSFSYAFVLEGAATESVMASGKLLTSISKSIISNCNSVSMVEFNQYRTDYTVTFGLMNTNKVEAFDCIDPSTNLTWGYMVCI